MKYLLTEHQVQMLNSIADCFDLESIRNITETLKPIEPLSNTVLWDMSADRFDESSYVEVITYARAIEAHILGETT